MGPFAETIAVGATLSGMGVRRSVLGLAVGMVVSVVCLGGCATMSAGPGGAGEEESRWAQVDDFPLSARTVPTLAWTGSEVFVVGGDTGPPCPPAADCAWGALARDGAAFDPVEETWRVIRE